MIRLGAARGWVALIFAAACADYADQYSIFASAKQPNAVQVMYIRFITTYRDERGPDDECQDSTGVFQALGFLSRSEETFEYDH